MGVMRVIEVNTYRLFFKDNGNPIRAVVFFNRQDIGDAGCPLWLKIV
jgi:hypothetical protein